MDRFSVIQGDITKQKVDAIVNAANSSLLGGGVDGAIHKGAGPLLQAECKQLGGCLTGEAKKTKAYDLPVKWVLHTVGPIWSGGDSNEDELLASCYRNALNLAVDLGVKTIAFPSISTGVYGFPVDRAAKIAVREIAAFLKTNDSIKHVFMVAYDTNTQRHYEVAAQEL